jgi:nucleoside recognition membrane protein YjiH
MVKTKKWVVVIAILVIASVAAMLYVFYGGERNVETEESVYAIHTTDLAKEFAADAQKAQEKYNNKTISIQGITQSSSATEIVLDQGVICSFSAAAPQTNTGQNITIKGRFAGYDDLLAEFKFDNCMVLSTH